MLIVLGVLGVLGSDDGAPPVALCLLLGQVGCGHEQLPHEINGAELQVQVVNKGFQCKHDLCHIALHVLPLLSHCLHKPRQDV